jgi:hypothetical protein
MFGFLYREMEMSGSADRFPKRIKKFRKAEKRFPILQHYFWWVMHNCITHFLIGIVPIKPFFQFHDWTSVKLNAGESALSTPLDDLEACKAQVEKVREKLKEISDNQDADSIFETSSLIDTIEKDINYHTQNGESRARRLRKATRIIFKEK